MKDIKILIATHKKFHYPQSDLFLPVQVGRKIANIKLNIQGDDDGFNISEKNPYYCELTALYWSWKNVKVDIVGLCHYRRYFNFSKRAITKSIYSIGLDEINKTIPQEIKIRKILSQFDIILPKPIVYPYSLDIDYKIGQIREDLNILYDVIKEISPEYFNSAKKYLLYNNKLYHYNMFISNNDFLNSYCKWLFKILFEVEKRIKFSPYPYQQRVFGFWAKDY